eukprot:TRINITY_DN4809_c0_g1_i4.p1 TRINITY_DN4809_c0_g1~~TRINITY_DN4809_c0_g1_i4.p1  ORF type:complete len:676 (-),score=242.98 TRINITY_DN4809_c0_g1_i4:144-2111(-)
MVKKKGKSGRTTLKQKYKIDRKVKEHKRQQRKDAKKNPHLHKKKDPGIPNSIPFKAEVLAEIEYAKKRAEEHKQAQKDKRKLELARRRGLLPPEATMESLAEKAAATQAAFMETDDANAAGDDAGMEAKERRHGEQSRRAYLRELRKVVDHSDVVLQVLDARDPLGSRASAVEEAVLSRPGKKLVLVLNKVDLVPKEVVAQWLKVLREDHPTVAFKASTQGGGGSRQQVGGDANKAGMAALSRSGSIGAEALMNILKNYCRSLDIKTAITVGIIGYPNVGKSSLINSLKRSKAVGVSPTPGFTKAMQEVQLDKLVKLLDCPGVVFDDADGSAVLLRNCVDCESMPNPDAAVEAVLQRCKPEQLMQVYEIARFDPADVAGFLALVARKFGKLLKGGTPDRSAAARQVLRDWNSGKVPYYTLPPEATADAAAARSAAASGDAQIVDSFGPAFDPLALEAIDQEMMEALPSSQPSGFLALRSGGVSAGRWSAATRSEAGDDMDEASGNEEDDDEEESDDDSDDPIKMLAKRQAQGGSDDDSDDSDAPPRAAQQQQPTMAAKAAEKAQKSAALAEQRAEKKAEKKAAPTTQLGALLAEERRLKTAGQPGEEARRQGKQEAGQAPGHAAVRRSQPALQLCAGLLRRQARRRRRRSSRAER